MANPAQSNPAHGSRRPEVRAFYHQPPTPTNPVKGTPVEKNSAARAPLGRVVSWNNNNKSSHPPTNTGIYQDESRRIVGKVFLTPSDMTAHQVASYRGLWPFPRRGSDFEMSKVPRAISPVNQSRARLTFCMISITRHTPRGVGRGNSSLGSSLEDLLAIRGGYFSPRPPPNRRRALGSLLAIPFSARVGGILCFDIHVIFTSSPLW